MRGRGRGKRVVVQLPPAHAREARVRRGGAERPTAASDAGTRASPASTSTPARRPTRSSRRPRRSRARRCSSSATTSCATTSTHERSFSPAWREAAAFLQTTIVATPAELEQITRQIQEILAPYQASARASGTPRGARVVARQRPRGAQAVIPAILRENPNFRRYFIGQSVSLLGDQVDADRAAADRGARAARDAGADGRADDGCARPEPALLAARGRLGRPARPAPPGDARRPTSGAALLHRDGPGRVRVRPPDLGAALRRRVPARAR